MAQQQVLILKGSPRRRGNSAVLADQLAAGATAAGAAVSSFSLNDLDIHPCDACEACHGAGDGECIIQDDMQQLYPALRQADAIVIASPIYWFTFNAQVKLCIDRWYALEGPQGNALAGKRFAVLLTYADADPFISGAVNAIRTFQDMCRYLHADLVGFVYGTASQAGEISSQAQLLARAFQLGQQLASNP